MKAKKQYKTYKAKNHWVNVPILFLSVLGAVGLATNNVQAKDNLTPEQKELLELRKRNQQLEMENDILKQAALIFGRRDK